MKSFFMEDNKLSMGRLLSLITCVTGLAIGVISAFKGNANAQTTAICLGFVGSGIGSKILQKAQEK